MKARSILMLSPSRLERPDRVGGAERYVDDLALALSRHPLVRRVQVVAFSPRPATEHVNDKLSVQTYSTKWHKGNPANPYFNPRCLLTGDWDVLYLHQFHTWLTPAAIAWSKARGAPLILTDHNGGGPTYNRRLKLDRCIDSFLAVSRISAEDCALRPKHTEIIYGGVNVERFTPAPGTDAREGILFVGRAHPIKGLERLLDAASAVSTPGKLTLALAASGASLDYARSLMARWEASRGTSSIRVELQLNPDDESLLGLYRSHRWTVLPSIAATQGRECLGLTMLESLACDTPAAASPHTGISELATRYPSQAFKIVDDWKPFIAQALAEKPPSGGREWALNHATWSAVADRVMNSIAEL